VIGGGREVLRIVSKIILGKLVCSSFNWLSNLSILLRFAPFF